MDLARFGTAFGPDLEWIWDEMERIFDIWDGFGTIWNTWNRFGTDLEPILDGFGTDLTHLKPLLDGFGIDLAGNDLL